MIFCIKPYLFELISSAISVIALFESLYSLLSTSIALDKVPWYICPILACFVTASFAIMWVLPPKILSNNKVECIWRSLAINDLTSFTLFNPNDFKVELTTLSLALPIIASIASSVRTLPLTISHLLIFLKKFSTVLS